MKRVLSKRGVEVGSPRDCIREAAINRLISNPEMWFSFITASNIASYTYEQENVDTVLERFNDFSRAVQELIDNLEKACLLWKRSIIELCATFLVDILINSMHVALG